MITNLGDCSEGRLSRLFSPFFFWMLKTFTHQLLVWRFWHFHELIRICIRRLRGFFSLYESLSNTDALGCFIRKYKRVPEEVVYSSYSEYSNNYFLFENNQMNSCCCWVKPVVNYLHFLLFSVILSTLLKILSHPKGSLHSSCLSLLEGNFFLIAGFLVIPCWYPVVQSKQNEFARGFQQQKSLWSFAVK